MTWLEPIEHDYIRSLKSQWLFRGLGSILTEGYILLLEFLFSSSKASDANIGIIVNTLADTRPWHGF